MKPGGTQNRLSLSWPEGIREDVTEQGASEFMLKDKQDFDSYKKY